SRSAIPSRSSRIGSANLAWASVPSTTRLMLVTGTMIASCLPSTSIIGSRMPRTSSELELGANPPPPLCPDPLQVASFPPAGDFGGDPLVALGIGAPRLGVAVRAEPVDRVADFGRGL